MLTRKQEEFYNLLIKYYENNLVYPSLLDIKNMTNYKSYNSIYKYLKILELKHFLEYNKSSKRITYLQKINSKTTRVYFLDEDNYIELTNLDNNKEYVAIHAHNNRLTNYCIKNKDILIIEKTLVNIDNKLVLVYISGKYRVLKYEKKDSYCYLSDNYSNYFLPSFNCIIGKVKMVIRNI